MLRRAQIARRKRVLDLGAGWGVVTAELAQRTASGALIVALDVAREPLQDGLKPSAHLAPVQASAPALPFATGAFDLIFTQFALLWMPLPETLAALHRLLAPNGLLLAIEPDYGGLLEHPPAIATRDLWLAALPRVGANPLIGRQLPGALAARGFTLQVDLLSELYPPEPERFAFLRDLPLTPPERDQLRHIENTARALNTSWAQVAHLPVCLSTARKTT